MHQNLNVNKYSFYFHNQYLKTVLCTKFHQILKIFIRKDNTFLVKKHTLLFRLVNNMWVLFRAIKVIFVKIIRSPKQVLADGKSNDDLRRFKSTVKFPIIFFFF